MLTEPASNVSGVTEVMRTRSRVPPRVMLPAIDQTFAAFEDAIVPEAAQEFDPKDVMVKEPCKIVPAPIPLAIPNPAVKAVAIPPEITAELLK